MNPRTTDHLCWLLIIVALILLLCGCEPGHPYVQVKCTSAPVHTWTPWTNCWDKANCYGYMSQSRTCTICGFQYYEVH